MGTDELQGVNVAVQGAGHVGYYLCERLAVDGAVLTVSDIDQDRVNRAVDDFGATAVAPDEIYDVDCDVFAPCALGAIINDQTVRRLNCSIVAGAANNQLDEDRHGDALDAREILYAPDYVINAGGLINVYGEIVGYDTETAMKKAAEIYDTLLSVFDMAEEEGIPTYRAADRLARQRFYASKDRKETNESHEQEAAAAGTVS
jgi:leucine dehydrogenase